MLLWEGAPAACPLAGQLCPGQDLRSPELPAALPARCSECSGLGQPGMLNKLQAPSLREDPIPALDSPSGTARLPCAAFLGGWDVGSPNPECPTAPLASHQPQDDAEEHFQPHRYKMLYVLYQVLTRWWWVVEGWAVMPRVTLGGFHVPPYAKSQVFLFATPMPEAGPTVAPWGSGMPGAQGCVGWAGGSLAGATPPAGSACQPHVRSCAGLWLCSQLWPLWHRGARGLTLWRHLLGARRHPPSVSAMVPCRIHPQPSSPRLIRCRYLVSLQWEPAGVIGCLSPGPPGLPAPCTQKGLLSN